MSDIAKVLQVAAFAGNLKRFSRDDEPPYTLKHGVFVASYLAHEVETTDTAILSAALLFDCLVTTTIGAQAIESFFGSEICSILEEVSRLNPRMSVWTTAEEIDGGAHFGEKAKLVTLADLLISIGDLQTDPPSDWPLIRIQEAMTCAKGRFEKLRGVHPITESRIEELFAQVPIADRRRPNRYHWRTPEFCEQLKALKANTGAATGKVIPIHTRRH